MILCIDTSTDVCSVALCRDGQAITHEELYGGNAHAANLTPMIEKLMSNSDVTMDELDAVAVSSGPGSYTGLRIGVSTAKGICYALNKPLIAIPTLDVIAEAVFTANSDIEFAVPMIDARRMEVYTQIISRDGEKLTDIEAKVIDDKSFSEYLSTKKLFFAGNGSAKCKSVISNSNAHFIDNISPIATNMARLSQMKYNKQQFESVAYFEPFYLKEFVATIAKNKVI